MQRRRQRWQQKAISAITNWRFARLAYLLDNQRCAGQINAPINDDAGFAGVKWQCCPAEITQQQQQRQRHRQRQRQR